MDNRPIGVYDSGIGGLSVLREVARQLPQESVVYFGDTAHLPYGDKNTEEILAYNRKIFEILLASDCKMILSACNTSSSLALIEMQERYPDLPIMGLIQPGAELAVQASGNQRIGIFATTATVNSNAYLESILKINPDATVQQIACPEFVPLIESGKVFDPRTRDIVQKYVEQLDGVDTLLYGCTHYPAIEPILSELYEGKTVHLVDPAVGIVTKTKQELRRFNLYADNLQTHPEYNFIWSGDTPSQFNSMEFKQLETVKAGVL